MPTYRRLPGAYNQGCLWGILQGALSGLLVLSLKNPGYFYVAIVEGLFFYFVAGYFTTHRGGSSLRGIWAGFWAGIASTIVFWVIVLAGLLMQVLQYIQRIGLNVNDQQIFRTLYGTALQQTVPAVFNQPAGQQTNVGAVLLVSSCCAMTMGLIGGILGSVRLRARMRRKGYA
jgi:hypothetical protein